MKEILPFTQLVDQQKTLFDLESATAEAASLAVADRIKFTTEEQQQVLGVVASERDLVLDALRSCSVRPDGEVVTVKKWKPSWSGERAVLKATLGWDMMRLPVKRITPDDIGAEYTDNSGGLFLATTGDIYKTELYGAPVRRRFRALKSHRGHLLDLSNEHDPFTVDLIRTGLARLAAKHSLFT